MNNQERELTRVGIEALNAALAGLGYPPVGENPEVRFGDPEVFDFQSWSSTSPALPR
jgi:hypothetical protein